MITKMDTVEVEFTNGTIGSVAKAPEDWPKQFKLSDPNAVDDGEGGLNLSVMLDGQQSDNFEGSIPKELQKLADDVTVYARGTLFEGQKLVLKGVQLGELIKYTFSRTLYGINSTDWAALVDKGVPEELNPLTVAIKGPGRASVSDEYKIVLAKVLSVAKSGGHAGETSDGEKLNLKWVIGVELDDTHKNHKAIVGMIKKERKAMDSVELDL